MIKKNLFNEKFGPFIRRLRKEQKIGQRDFAKKIGIAASYLNDIEKEKRSAPKLDIIKNISELLKVESNYLNDLAGISKNEIAPDLNEYLKNILKKINTRSCKVAIIGLGYTGLPLLALFLKKKIKVVGIDKDKKKIIKLKKNISYISGVPNSLLKKNFQNVTYNFQYENINSCDIIIICLPTPLKKNFKPNLDYIKETLKKITPFLKKGQTLILESTSYPGTTRELIVKKLKNKFQLGKDFFIGFSSERINPGFKENSINKIPKVVSGFSENCLKVVTKTYSGIFDKIVIANSLEIAEFSKLLENIYRAVNISFINEMKFIADKMKLDIFEILKIAESKPFGFKRFNPGPGTGGHCIPIDPEYMYWKAKKLGIKANFIRLASKTNLKVVDFIKKKLKTILKQNKILLKNSKILLIGLSYKKNVADLRESSSLKLLSTFTNKVRRLDFHDKYIKSKINTRNFKTNEKSISISKKSLSRYDVVILMTDHDYLNYNMIYKYSKRLIDTRGIFKIDHKVIRA